MRKLLVMDAENYDPSLPEIYRTAVRGIIFAEGRLLMVCSCFGEVKFPGGGQEEGESDADTLIRETLEETGYHVIADSIREFGEVEEKRLSTKEPMIWHQINRYYFCDVEKEREECRYTDDERRYGFHQVWCTPEEAIRRNRDMVSREGLHAWNQRELAVLEMLPKANIRRGRYNEPGRDGYDVYGIVQRAKEHMRSVESL